MKKTLAALAVLGAFAGSAMAADVTLYGLIDTGLSYEHTNGDRGANDSQNKFQMTTGTNSGARFGLKGTEQLGNGYSVGFVLENGFYSDDGSLANGDRLFGREAQLFVKGPFGTLSAGRVGQLASANGSFGLLGVTSPFSTGWGDSIGPKFVMANGFDRFDNTVTYATPTFAGLTVFAQYSFDKDTKGTNWTTTTSSGTTNHHGIEGQSSVDRYYGLGAKYVNGGLTLVGVVDSTNYASYPANTTATANNIDDSLTVTLGGNYDFGVVKAYVLGQYFKNAQKFGTKNVGPDGSFAGGYSFTGFEGAKGYGLTGGVDVPAFGGVAKAWVGYGDAQGENNSDAEVSRWSFALGYQYNLSKRTSLYTAAAYTRDDVTKEYLTTATDYNPSSVEVTAGLIHKF